LNNTIQIKEYKFKGSLKRIISADLTYSNYTSPVPIVVFAHGFKGFKDWGAWSLAAGIFASKGLPFFLNSTFLITVQALIICLNLLI